MKKTLFAVLAACSLLSAESYQVNTLSAKQLGMAHTGAGLKLGSESMNFNPAGMGFLDKKLDVSAGVTFIIPEVEFIGSKGEKAVNDELGTPLYVYIASSINDWLSAGLSFTTPYGNSLSFGKTWEGAELLQDISLAVYAIQPTVAFKFRNDVSIGVGPVVYFGSFEQNKSLGRMASAIGTINVASAEFSGDADVAVGANIGIFYDLIPSKFTLGVGYRSEAKMKVSKGEAKVNYLVPGSESMPALIALDGAKFKAELPLPANLNTGISFRPTEKLLLAFDWQVVFWGAYKELVLDIDSLGKQVSQKNYHNTDAYRLGAQYTLLDQLDLRLGVYYDETPVDDDYLTPESPSTNKLGTTFGFSFRPIPNLSIDASFLYSNGSGDLGRDATSGSNPDKVVGDKADGIDGRYEVQAWVPSVGLNFSF